MLMVMREQGGIRRLEHSSSFHRRKMMLTQYVPQDTSLFSSGNPLLFEQRYSWKPPNPSNGLDAPSGLDDSSARGPLPNAVDENTMNLRKDHPDSPAAAPNSPSAPSSRPSADHSRQPHKPSSPSAPSSPSSTADPPSKRSGRHLLVLVHGLHGNPYDLRMVKNSITVAFPESLCYCSQANEDDTEQDIAAMGERLAREVEGFIEDSLGNVGNVDGPGGEPGAGESGNDVNDREGRAGRLGSSSRAEGGRVERTGEDQSPATNPEAMGGATGAAGADGGCRSSDNIGSLRLSFIGHSLGGLMVRAALPHLMKRFGNCFHTYLTFSTMHLGVMYNENRLVETGLWVLKQWRNSKCLQQLSLSDWRKSPRESFLYSLSEQPGLDLFQHVVLVSSWQDQYCPFDSARLEISDDTLKRCRPNESAIGDIFVQMASNILGRIHPNRLTRFNVNFHIPEASLDSIIGRAAHIQFLENATLMKMLVVNYKQFFE